MFKILPGDCGVKERAAPCGGNGRYILRAASSGRSEAVNPCGISSDEGLAIGATGTLLVNYSHLTDIPLGSHCAARGPIAFALLCCYLMFYTLLWMKRKLTGKGKMMEDEEEHDSRLIDSRLPTNPED